MIEENKNSEENFKFHQKNRKNVIIYASVSFGVIFSIFFSVFCYFKFKITPNKKIKEFKEFLFKANLEILNENSHREKIQFEKDSLISVEIEIKKKIEESVIHLRNIIPIIKSIFFPNNLNEFHFGLESFANKRIELHDKCNELLVMLRKNGLKYEKDSVISYILHCTGRCLTLLSDDEIKILKNAKQTLNIFEKIKLSKVFNVWIRGVEMIKINIAEDNLSEMICSTDMFNSIL